MIPGAYKKIAGANFSACSPLHFCLQDRQPFGMVDYNSPKVIKADFGEFLLISELTVRAY